MIIDEKARVGINPYEEPDVDDPNSYCKSCKKYFSRKSNNRVHLERVHDMTLAPLRNTTKQALEIESLNSEENSQEPDVQDTQELDLDEPNSYCKACDKYFYCKGNYRQHLRYKHKMILAPLPRFGRQINHSSNDEELDVNEPNSYCKACKKYFSCKQNYRQHLQYKHQMILEPLPKFGRHINHSNNDVDTEELDENEPSFFCKACEKQFANKSNYRQHLRCVHKMTLTPLPRFSDPYKIKHIHLKPDMDDPNFYCKACEKRYSCKGKYRGHLIKIHKMKLDRAIRRKTRYCKTEDDMQPDLDNPGFYCKVCKRRYSTKSNYRSHLLKIHKINAFNRPAHSQPTTTKTKTRQMPEVDDPNFYCKVCKTHYSHKGSYRQHLRKIHHMHLAPIKIKRIIKYSNLQPDVNDPDFYCKACDKYYSTKSIYGTHIRKVHNMAVKFKRVYHIKNSNLRPDVDDPDFYCKACDKYYSAKNIYRTHLRKIHNMTLPQPFSINRNIQPDIDDPDSYCKACERYYTNKAGYVQHLRKCHDILPPPKVNKYADLQPDVDDPDFYCKACDKRYSSKSTYGTHIRKIHNMTVSFKRIYHIKNSNIQPDINDPDNYCKACEKGFAKTNGYRQHLRKCHDIITPPKNNKYADLQPDIDDPDLYRRACDKSFSTKSNYSTHLFRIHRIKRDKIDRSHVQPDVDDLDFYCNACEKKYSSKYGYRAHLWKVHDMAPVSLRSSDQTVNNRDSRMRVTRQRRLTRSLLL